ncbi:Z-ring formation inhibitor MciZ [Paenibacillus sp. GCM10027626]|uniref:Z-ring formation inhibitor MciZ n=1 Tax=Paenibacillus sp. GCM10027626 TaxID=3273411 RepID=UPI00363A8A2E
MKQYLNCTNMTLVGKSWEIRHQLRTIAKHQQRKDANPFAPPMLKDYLQPSSAGQHAAGGK